MIRPESPDFSCAGTWPRDCYSLGETIGAVFRQGGRGSKSLGLSGRVTARVSRTGFFLGSKTFDYFSGNQNIQTTASFPPQPNASLFKQLHPISRATQRGWQRILVELFSGHGGRGDQKSGTCGTGPVGSRAHFSAKFGKHFFASRCHRARVGGGRTRSRWGNLASQPYEKSPRNSGWGGWGMAE
jgi:hypothetical protein